MSELSKEDISIAKKCFAVSIIVTYFIIVGVTIGISLLVGKWAPWWAYVLEAVIIVLVGWDMTTWQGGDADMEMPC